MRGILVVLLSVLFGVLGSTSAPRAEDYSVGGASLSVSGAILSTAQGSTGPSANRIECAKAQVLYIEITISATATVQIQQQLLVAGTTPTAVPTVTDFTASGLARIANPVGFYTCNTTTLASGTTSCRAQCGERT